MSSPKRKSRGKARQKRKPSLELLQLVASNLKAFRDERGLSQAGLAKRCGMRRKTQISNIEQVPDNVTLAVLETIAKGLGCPVYRLLMVRTRPRAR